VSTRIQVVFDCADPDRLARFWAGALGYVVQPPPEGYDSWEAFLAEMGVPESQWGSRSAIVDPEGAGPRIFFQQVPETKTVKNRVHLDVNASGAPGASEAERRTRVAEAVGRLVEAGASVQREFNEPGEHRVVMQDPEGNEFCVQ
jgi:hypothetical protein